MSKKSRKQVEMYVGKVELSMFYESIGTNVFQWEGLPENIRPFYPEQTLYRQGMACMIQLPGTDEYDIFPVAYGSVELDLHGEPLSWRCYVIGESPGANIIRNTVYNNENSVLIWNNPTRTGMSKYVDSQIDNMLRTDNALKTNTLVQNTPVFVTADGKNALTAKNLFEMYGIENVVYANDYTKNDISMDVINLGVQFIGDKLSDQYETYNNRILRYLGINHLPVEKQERMLTGEVDSNDLLIETVTKSRLDMRKIACEQINSLWGLNVEVDTYESVIEQRNMERMQSTSSTSGETPIPGKTGGEEQPKD